MGPVAKVLYGRRRRAKDSEDQAVTRAAVPKLQLGTSDARRDP
jgi:hypothetical protein